MFTKNRIFATISGYFNPNPTITMENENYLPIDNGFIPFTSDYGFKVTFGNENDTRFLRKALQALICSPHKIVHITFDKNDFIGLTDESRSGIYDLSCIDETGAHFIV
ncbi:MAG: PD-(D/E)XK nuclease family transposase, partial [Chitinophagales bacterium]|nr:PD-(D/E)XK nuclease family transposase [Chitinophagales bacterium]